MIAKTQFTWYMVKKKADQLSPLCYVWTVIWQKYNFFFKSKNLANIKEKQWVPVRHYSTIDCYETRETWRDSWFGSGFTFPADYIDTWRMQKSQLEQFLNPFKIRVQKNKSVMNFLTVLQASYVTFLALCVITGFTKREYCLPWKIYERLTCTNVHSMKLWFVWGKEFN